MKKTTQLGKPQTARLGFILYQGKSHIGEGNVVCIATLKCRNGKTGNMVQVWIVPDGTLSPLEAVQNNANAAACGTCPLQGVNINGKTEGRVCYVNLGQAPAAVWKAYQAGKYPVYSRRTHEHFLKGRSIRIGAYGDPAALPVRLVKYLANVGSGWTGYSHQLFWLEERRASALASVLMASCHTPAMHKEARRRGWRSFVAIAEGQAAPDNAVECPNYTRGVTCQKCQLCQGTSKQAKDVYVIAHAKVGLNLPKVQEKQGVIV